MLKKAAADIFTKESKMKKLQRAARPGKRIRMIALATAAATAGVISAGAQAQEADATQGLTYKTPTDVVTLYGLLDITASSKNNADAKGNRLSNYQVSWFSGDRWGITGKHSIGNEGLKAIFKLESEFDIRTGEEDTAGVLFNRDAWVGFESDTIGKLTFGRQNALARDYSGIYGDPYGGAGVSLEEGGYTNTNNFKQLIFYAASATGTRYDRGIVWKKKFGNFYAGLGYQFGGVAGDFQNGTTKTAAFGYNAGVFNVAGFYNQAMIADREHKSYSIGGNVILGPMVRLNAGYFHYTAEQPVVGERKDKAYTISTKITPPGKIDFELGYQVFKAENAGYTSAGFIVRPYTDTSAVRTAGAGDRKTAYASVFYHFDKRTEVYVAADKLKITSGYKDSAIKNGRDSQTELAVGMRFRF